MACVMITVPTIVFPSTQFSSNFDAALPCWGTDAKGSACVSAQGCRAA